MFSLGQQMKRTVVVAARRQFGADASHNPQRMQFDEWKSLLTKLHGAPSATEKQQITSRFKEARLAEREVSDFHQRLRVQQMTEEEFQAYRHDIANGPYSKTHPILSKHHDAVAVADRANTPRPDMFDVTYGPSKVWTKEELGAGNVAQKRMNEYLYEMQTNPETAYKRAGGFGLDRLDMARTQKQSIIFFFSSIPFAFTGANLYRNLYMEKYSLFDMFNWETRVICARAQKERGW